MPNDSNSASLGHQPPADDQKSKDAETVNIELFKKHVSQLFGGERGGHMARWVYMDLKRGGDLSTGSELWSAFVRASIDGRNNYYYPQQEAALINDPETITSLRAHFGHAKTLVDFGSGDDYAVQNKAMPLVHGLSGIQIYSPLDISAMMLNRAVETANDNISKEGSSIRVLPIHADFSEGLTLADRQPIRIQEETSDKLGIFLGSTITNQEMDQGGNFPKEKIVEKIAKLGNILNNGERKGPLSAHHGLVVGYDANLDTNSAVQAYKDEGDLRIWAPLVTGVMFDIKSRIDPQPWSDSTCGFDPQGWRHAIIPESGPPLDPNDPESPPQYIVLHQCVVAEKHQDFKIENGEPRRFKIKEGDTFVIKNNFKFHPMFFRQLAREAGFNPLDPIRKDGNHAVLQPLEVSY